MCHASAFIHTLLRRTMYLTRSSRLHCIHKCCSSMDKSDVVLGAWVGLVRVSVLGGCRSRTRVPGWRRFLGCRTRWPSAACCSPAPNSVPPPAFEALLPSFGPTTGTQQCWECPWCRLPRRIFLFLRDCTLPCSSIMMLPNGTRSAIDKSAGQAHDLQSRDLYAFQ